MKQYISRSWHICGILLAIILAACGPQATAVHNPYLQNVTPKPPTAKPSTLKPPTQRPASLSSGAQGSSGSYNFSVPSTPAVPFGDIMDIVAFLGTGGGGDWSPSCPCAEATSSGANLKGFEPNTNLRVIVYEMLGGSNGLYLTQWNITTDAKGSATIKASGLNSYKKYQYAVFDSQSGEKLAPRGLGINDVSKMGNNGCPANIKTRLAPGMTARVTMNGESLYIRYGVTIAKSTVIAELPEGRMMKIIYGPDCNDGHVWWLVRTEKYNGWVAEGKKGEWYIEPVP